MFVDLCQDLRWDEKLFPVDDRCKDGTQGTCQRVQSSFGDLGFYLNVPVLFSVFLVPIITLLTHLLLFLPIW